MFQRRQGERSNTIQDQMKKKKRVNLNTGHPDTVETVYTHTNASNDLDNIMNQINMNFEMDFPLAPEEPVLAPADPKLLRRESTQSNNTISSSGTTSLGNKLFGRNFKTKSLVKDGLKLKLKLKP